MKYIWSRGCAFFPRTRSEGFPFYTLGVWGLRCVRSTPLSNVRKSPFERKFAVPLGSFTGVVIFGRFTCLQPSFRVAGVALRDMWTCLATCGKSFFVAGAILLQRFHNMLVIFRGRRSTLDVSDSIFRGRRSTSDVSCCVFFANRIGTAVRNGNHVQIPWQAWHFVTCVKIGGSLARNARFEACTCVLACLWMRSNYGGSCNALRLRLCQSVKIGGSLARNARFDACMCVVLRFWLCSGCAVTMGEAAMPYV